MDLSNQHTLPVAQAQAQAQAWEALNDMALLQQAIPGGEAITPAGENRFDLLMTAAIGPVKAKFKGKLQLEDLPPPHRYALRFEGQGGAAGHRKGRAEVRLEAAGPHSTVLHCSAQAWLGRIFGAA